MITLTKLNGQPFLLNVLLFERVEFLPDSTITLTNGHKYIVKESQKEIEAKIMTFYKEIGLTSSMNKLGVLDEDE
ncbi:flagellar FlbD family protein [Bacillus kexueae]|uniref:flagellar FlbD family protein n=1 Tax=Aeribacillus kexueae TaxID=2078952 RepID=UPI001FAED2C2|nr:flagellar FlbD family protein [Bacillus kexueae]